MSWYKTRIRYWGRGTAKSVTDCAILYIEWKEVGIHHTLEKWNECASSEHVQLLTPNNCEELIRCVTVICNRKTASAFIHRICHVIRFQARRVSDRSIL